MDIKQSQNQEVGNAETGKIAYKLFYVYRVNALECGHYNGNGLWTKVGTQEVVFGHTSGRGLWTKVGIQEEVGYTRRSSLWTH